MLKKYNVVGVAQTAEHQVVALVVAGSSPVAHPSKFKMLGRIDLISFFFSQHYSQQSKKKEG